MLREQTGHHPAAPAAAGHRGGYNRQQLLSEVEALLLLSQEYNLAAFDDFYDWYHGPEEVQYELLQIKKNYRSYARRLKVNNPRLDDHLFTLDKVAEIFNGQHNKVVAQFLTTKKKRSHD